MNIRSLHFRLMLWYALWLGVVFIIMAVLVFFGMREYLERRLVLTQTQRAQRIATLVMRTNIITSDRALSDEITARYAPEATGRFIRVTTPERVVRYESGMPLDRSFDPEEISPPSGKQGTRNEVQADGTELVFSTVAAGPPKSPRFLIETGESLAPAIIELRRQLFLLALGFISVAGMALGGGFLLVRRALRPVEEITRSAEQITSHNLNERLSVPPTGDEFEHLSHTLNRMITRLDEAFQYNRRFLADASHELRTPLTVLRGELESLVNDAHLPPEIRERLGSTLEEAERLAQIVEALFAIARLDAGEAQAESTRFDLAQLVASTADQMLLLAEDKKISVTTIGTAETLVIGDRARIKQVIVNLLDNAIKYTPEGGAISLRVSATEAHAVLEIEDTGIGIPEVALPHIFERFYRVDKARSRELGGAGLGLSIVKSICTAHDGNVSASSSPGKGSKFKLELPLATSGTDLKSKQHEH